MLKACVNIAPKSNLTHILSSSVAATCVILWNQDFDICLILVQTSCFHTYLYGAVPSHCKIFEWWCWTLLPLAYCHLSNVFWDVVFDFLQENSKSWVKDVDNPVENEGVWNACLSKNKISYHSKVILVQCLSLYWKSHFRTFSCTFPLHPTKWPCFPLRTRIISCFSSPGDHRYCVMPNVFVMLFLKKTIVVKALLPV